MSSMINIFSLMLLPIVFSSLFDPHSLQFSTHPTQLDHGHPTYHQMIQTILHHGDQGIQQLENTLNNDLYLPCVDKLLYYNQMIALSRMILIKKNKQLSNHPNYMDRYRAIARENELLKGRAYKMGIFDLNEKLSKTSNLLNLNQDYKQDLKKQQQIISSTIEQHYASIDGYQHKVQHSRNLIEQKELSLIKVSSQIAKVEEELMMLRVQKGMIIKEIQHHQQTIILYEGEIQNLKLNIQQQEQKIQAVIDQLFNLKSKNINLKIDIQLLEDKAHKYEVDAILHTIHQNNRIMKELLHKQSQRDHLHQYVHTLTASLSHLQSQVTPMAQMCFDAVYDGSGLKVGSLPLYLHSVYGDQVSLPSNSYVFADKFYPIAASKFLYEDFNCLTTQNQISGNGRITHITKHHIQIQTIKGQFLYLMVGSCSRVEASRQDLREGKTMYFRGNIHDNRVDVAFATCF